MKKFIYFLNKYMNKNFKSINFYFSKKKNKKVITLLKSPHVNKTAQEQFEIKFFNFKLKVITTQAFKFLIFLKKIKNYTFADIQIKIKFLNNSKNQFLLKRKILNINNFKNIFFKKIEIYSKTFNVTELLFKKIHKKLNYKKKYFKSRKILKLIDFLGH